MNKPAARRLTPLVLILFVGSGCAALIYEVVWFHLLRLVVGSSAISLAFLLGSFMGGMCLGGLVLPRVTPRHWHPLRVYAALELGIGACGLALPSALPAVAVWYQDHAGSGMTGFVLRGSLCAAALLPPTMLMGATLPAIARWLDTTRDGLARLGLFYGANIVGAVLGTLMAGFWLLRVHDIVVATRVAVWINVAVAVVGVALAGRSAFRPAAADETAAAPGGRRAALWLAIGLSGFTALGAEVLWTRLLSLLLGATVYAFTLILAVFLVGLGVGSGAGARLARRSARPDLWFAACQALLAPAIVWGAFAVVAILPFGEPTRVFQPVVYENALIRFPWNFARCSVAMLPATVLWGASFPLALAAAGAGQRDPGRLVGGLYAANTVGAIAGALLVGLFLIGNLGTQKTQQLMALTAGATAILVLATARSGTRARLLRVAALGAPVAALSLALARLIPATPPGLIAHGRIVEDWECGEDYRYVAEGVNASVAVTELDDCICFHVSGKVVASTDPMDMRLQKMLGHLPALIHPGPRRVLVVGCGAGVTAGTFTDHPTVERIVVCEIEPRVVEGARRFLGDANLDVLDDPRTEVVIDDARHFLATSREKFDIITSDPIHPWVRGAAMLYSTEYHDLVARHLAPGGIVTQWVPLYETDEDSVRSQIGTFARAFPDVTLWHSDLQEKGYDLVLLAGDGPLAIDIVEIERRIEDNEAVRDELDAVGLGSAMALLSTYAGRGADLRPWLVGAAINADVSLRLQYLAGLALDVDQDDVIYAEIRAHWRYPDDLFLVPGWLERTFRKTLTER
jgi:spermidine synthase